MNTLNFETTAVMYIWDQENLKYELLKHRFLCKNKTPWMLEKGKDKERN